MSPTDIATLCAGKMKAVDHGSPAYAVACRGVGLALSAAHWHGLNHLLQRPAKLRELNQEVAGDLVRLGLASRIVISRGRGYVALTYRGHDVWKHSMDRND
jgi:hypothetical protein